MTRTYILCALLEHGPMTRRELLEVTGWAVHILKRAMDRLLRRGYLRRMAVRGESHFVYGLAA